MHCHVLHFMWIESHLLFESMPLKWPLMQMVWDVCPQIFTQSFRRLRSNWCRNHLARLQHINYFHCFSKLIEHNYYSFALINRMLNTSTMPGTVALQLLEVISKIKVCRVCGNFSFSLTLSLSLLLWVAVSQIHMPVVHRAANQIWQQGL